MQISSKVWVSCFLCVLGSGMKYCKYLTNVAIVTVGTSNDRKICTVTLCPNKAAKFEFRSLGSHVAPPTPDYNLIRHVY